MAQLQGLLEHKAGLGHGALGGVHQQQHAVHHLQNALHLAGEVGVTGGVHNVDLVILIVYGGVLGENGDSPLPLQVAGVHDPVHHRLVLAIHAALLEHLVHQGRLAVIDVGDDGDIPNFFLCHKVGPFRTDKSQKTLNNHSFYHSISRLATKNPQKSKKLPPPYRGSSRDATVK